MRNPNGKSKMTDLKKALGGPIDVHMGQPNPMSNPNGWVAVPPAKETRDMAPQFPGNARIVCVPRDDVIDTEFTEVEDD